jgi:predicted nucleic acid-binding Zn ribbon protein
MDEADRAEQHEQIARDIALRRRKPVPPAEAYGHCMNCGMPLDAKLVYCDRDCQIDHERAELARARNGK